MAATAKPSEGTPPKEQSTTAAADSPAPAPAPAEADEVTRLAATTSLTAPDVQRMKVRYTPFRVRSQRDIRAAALLLCAVYMCGTFPAAVDPTLVTALAAGNL